MTLIFPAGSIVTGVLNASHKGNELQFDPAEGKGTWIYAPFGDDHDICHENDLILMQPETLPYQSLDPVSPNCRSDLATHCSSKAPCLLPLLPWQDIDQKAGSKITAAPPVAGQELGPRRESP